MIYDKKRIDGRFFKYKGIYARTKSDAEKKKAKFKEKFPRELIRMIPTIGKYGQLKGKRVYLQYTTK